MIKKTVPTPTESALGASAPALPEPFSTWTVEPCISTDTNPTRSIGGLGGLVLDQTNVYPAGYNPMRLGSLPDPDDGRPKWVGEIC